MQREDNRKDRECAIASAVAVSVGSSVAGYALNRIGLRSGTEIKIGSFNLKNFKAHVFGKDPDPKYRESRLRAIAKIIQSQAFAIVALQEVKDEATVSEICRTINGCGNRYQGVHCARFYQQLFPNDGTGFQNKTHGGAQAKGELAYIWDSSVVEPATDEYAKVVYRDIDTRVNHAWDIFFSALAALYIAGMRIASINKKQKGGRSSRVKETVTDSAAVGLAAVAIGANQTSATAEIDAGPAAAEAFLQSQIRPPLVALFNLKHDTNKQLRLINVHLQFGLTDADEEVREDGERDSELKMKVRRKEAEFVAGKLFEIVDSQRSGRFETVYTLALGDFNLEPKDFQYEDKKSVLPADMIMAQTDESTLSVRNVKETEPGKRVSCCSCSIYDHFLFRSDVWDPKDASVMNWNCDDFFVPKQIEQKEVLYPVSDHCPVMLTTSKI